jgi:hypothetical protein
VKIVLIILFVASLTAAAFAAYLLLKKEDPRSVAYSCSTFFTFSDQALSDDADTHMLTIP